MNPFIIGSIISGGVSLLSNLFSTSKANNQNNSQEAIARESRELQRELTTRREGHEKEMQGLSFVFQSKFSKEMHELQKQHDTEMHNLNFEFQDNLESRREEFTAKMHKLQKQHDIQMQTLRFEFEKQMRKDNLLDQGHLAYIGAWYRYLDKNNIPPFPPGQFIQRISPSNAQKPFVLFDTKVYQEENHPNKILDFNPMQLLYTSFCQVNREFGDYANVFDIPISFGSRINAQYFSKSEFYDKPTIIIYGNFSGTRLEIRALCNGIFAHQLYTNAAGKTCVNPSQFVEISLGSYILSEELSKHPIVLESIYNCFTASYLQMLLDDHRVFFNFQQKLEPTAQKVFQNKLAEVKQYFADAEEFGKIDEQLSLHVQNFNKQQLQMENNNRLAMQMRHPDKSTLLGKGEDADFDFYQLNLTQTFSDKKNGLFKYNVGEDNPLKVQTHKIIMLLGATGSGKTTLINGMINYILGVDFTDNVRYKLIVEPTANQAKSQTKYISAYTLHNVDGSPLNYKITIIDTPGFGDTTGLEQDKKIVEQIREFFSMKDGIMDLDAVGFVAQASLARLTQPQRYIFDSILALFGKDIVDNIFLMLTFADGQEPPVLAAVKEHKVPYKYFSKFNNSALFANNKATDDDDDNFDGMFWKMGEKSFKKFFKHLETTQSVSLRLTKDVLQERKQLEATISGLRPLMDEGLAKMSTLADYEQIVGKHEKDIEQNKNFKFNVTREKVRKVPTPSGRCITTCYQCHKPPCHNPCGLSPTDDKRGCAVMQNEHCTVCGCHWSKHANTPFMYESYFEKETQTSEDLLKKYNIAIDAKNKTQTLIDRIQAEFEEIAENVLVMTDQVRKSLTQLDKIALKPNPLTSIEYLDLSIQDEKNNKTLNWERRVAYYEAAKKEADFLQEISAGTDGSIKQILEQKAKLKKKSKKMGKSLIEKFTDWVGGK